MKHKEIFELKVSSPEFALLLNALTVYSTHRNWGGTLGEEILALRDRMVYGCTVSVKEFYGKSPTITTLADLV